MGRVSKGEKCSFCSGQAFKSISAVEASKYFNIKAETRKRVYLCRDHYKEYKRKSKGDRDLERSRW
ncbi:MAG: hypothetical protein QFX33_02000 [Candidatus Nezhaarchaeota archaeon]|nr:hypothetical protein [Candidatus Nezhaarchaeota archaeon]